ncbi:MAG TPA: SpoIID/LytB domain-containing protein [Tepidisphaeraceae bacterium]|jgi:stage II sporulation protein D|nr:SpoIID/LytB domain-containing protein [Tepidisphaeraceae bacterium]
MTQRIGLIILAALLLVLLPFGGCQQDNLSSVSPRDPKSPVVRVRLLEGRDRIALTASANPTVRTGADRPITLNLPHGTPIDVTLAAGGWRVGDQMLGTGELVIEPATPGSVKVDNQSYRGRYRLVPTGPGKFDVVNDVDVDGYLMGVVSKEVLPNWDEETFKAQAIVARTYALYEMRTASRSRAWDLFPDQRSQVYGGIGAESAKSRTAVDATHGVVVAAGARGQEKIFPAYFSSCCGGATQSAVDAFGFDQPHIAPLGEQNVKTLCAASPRFSWGEVAVRKDELTRRFRLFAARRSTSPGDVWTAATNMATVTSIEVAPQGINSAGRPVRFIITDARGVRYSFSGEELRTAINTDAPKDNRVFSSFFKLINAGDTVRFVDGHGWGHGVGMCQWCAESRARQGMRHEDIVLAAFPTARLVRAY